MTLDKVLALMGFAFVMSVSPGPANLLLLVSGANFGFRRSLPLMFGIGTGFLTMVLCVGVGLGGLFRTWPVIETTMKLICTAYVLWLALKIARSRTLGAADGKAVSTPISFVQAALFQVLNPKAWAVALIVTVSYTDPNDHMRSLLTTILLFAVVNLPSISLWAISGNLLQTTLQQGRRLAVFNIVMSLLLVGSMIPVLAGSAG
ncbi:MAG: LysE family translocator [Alphaproteobacteria bacterium]|nr:LysE family translocator [Alphaproteobacteria bacterium]